MIEALHLSKSYGAFRAVDDISFAIPGGQIVGLLGPNGAGKSTTMKMLAGFLAPDAGEIRIDGAPVTGADPAEKAAVGYMPENVPFYADMIVADYLAYVARIFGLEPRARLSHLAGQCGLGAVMHKNIGELSRGYRQRVGLAHALMNEPGILILDEPTSGLDPNQIVDVRALIRDIGRTRTVIISTHILGEVEAICDRAIILAHGRIAADSPMDELRKSRDRSFVFVQIRGCTQDELLGALKKIHKVRTVEFVRSEPLKRNGFVAATIGVAGKRDIRPALFTLAKERGWVLYELTQKKKALEDIFHELTEHRQ